VKVLFVCLGNICRSPTAHGVMLRKLKEAGLDWVEVDSAGTAAYHVGHAPDERAQQVARQYGYDLSGLRARQATEDDFFEFDHIFAMDNANYQNLQAIKPADSKAQLSMALAYSDLSIDEVPDPYYGGSDGFTQVLNICEQLCDDIIEQLIRSRS
jgi:protein-tyrosine phosphatase